MKEKKVMKLWQMAVILVLSVLMLVTMFLPAYHITPDALQKGMENAQEKDDFYENDDKRDEDIKWYKKKFKKKLNKEKKENETDNETISTLNLMTKSLTDIRYNGKYDEEYAKSDKGMGEENYDALNKKHTITKVMLWLVYGMLLVVILVTILGYCLKWNKYIPLGIDTAYGGLTALAFAILHFGTIRGIADEVRAVTEQFIGYEFNNIDTAKLSSCFLAGAFLVGLFAAIALLIVSVVAMVTGNQVYEEADEEDEKEFDDWGGDDWNNQNKKSARDFGPDEKTVGYIDNDQRMNLFRDDNKAIDVSEQKTVPSDIFKPDNGKGVQKKQKQVVKQPAAKQAAGKVRCTKGMTSGAAGYTLPQDRKVIIGKSPRQANLVIVNNASISNVHCTIRYNAQKNTYSVRDHSMNGTFVNGMRLPKDSLMEYPSGTVLTLSDGSVEITLG